MSNPNLSQVRFAICNSCFWCASMLYGRSLTTCPCCAESKIESLPIAENESYLFDYDSRHGAVLEFQIDQKPVCA